MYNYVMIFKEKKIKSTLLLLAMFIMITFGMIISFHQYNVINDEIESDIKAQNRYIHKTFNLFLNKLKKDMTIKSGFMIATPGVKKAFNDLNREELYSLLKKPYQKMLKQNKYIKIITFRLKDGSTFLRVHKPKMFGDKLNKKRKIILDTIATQKIQYGFEVGKLKMTYRVVTPIFYQNNFIGVVEFGIEPESITDDFNKLFNIKTALLIKKADKSISLDRTKLEGIGDYLFARGDKLFKTNLNKIGLNKKPTKLSFNDTDYLIDTSLILTNHNGDTAAIIPLAYSLKEYDDRSIYLLKHIIPATIIMLLILFIVLNIGLNIYIKKIRGLHKDIIKKDSLVTQNSKMAAMGEMLESIAHQWRQPLSVITTSSSGMKLRKELGVLDDKAFEESCDEISNSAQHLSQTIEDFRGFFKQNKDKKPFNLSNAFNNTFNLIISKFKSKDITINKNLTDTHVMGIENEFMQVLLNILNNARDALENIDQKKLLFIDIYSDDAKAIVKIKDNAGGIPKDILIKVFDPHFTTKDPEKGTGIGLYMSKKIIQDSFKGTIEVQNVVYEYEGGNYYGAEFTIKLPLHKQLIL